MALTRESFRKVHEQQAGFAMEGVFIKRPERWNRMWQAAPCATRRGGIAHLAPSSCDRLEFFSSFADMAAGFATRAQC